MAVSAIAAAGIRGNDGQTEDALKKQAGVELVLRFLAFRRVPYKPGLDVHEYLDKALVEMAGDANFPATSEQQVFERTFRIMQAALGGNAFRRWDGAQFTGKFLMSLFEVIATGVSANIDAIEGLSTQDPLDFIRARAKDLWNDAIFQNNSGAGVRGTTRLAKLLPMGPGFFRP